MKKPIIVKAKCDKCGQKFHIHFNKSLTEINMVIHYPVKPVERVVNAEVQGDDGKVPGK